MQTTTDPAADVHAAVRFSSAEWGVLEEQERGKALRCTSEAPGTGRSVARQLRDRARHRLNQGRRPRDVGPVVLTGPAPDASRVGA